MTGLSRKNGSTGTWSFVAYLEPPHTKLTAVVKQPPSFMDSLNPEWSSSSFAMSVSNNRLNPGDLGCANLVQGIA